MTTKVVIAYRKIRRSPDMPPATKSAAKFKRALSFGMSAISQEFQVDDDYICDLETYM